MRLSQQARSAVCERVLDYGFNFFLRRQARIGFDSAVLQRFGRNAGDAIGRDPDIGEAQRYLNLVQ